MKKVYSFLVFTICGFSALYGQTLTCNLNSGSTWNLSITASAGDPCVYTATASTTSANLSAGRVVLTNATCTNCPTTPAGGSETWTITSTTSGPCGTAPIPTMQWSSFAINFEGCPSTVVPLSAPLPVELLEFNVSAKHHMGYTELHWATASETSNKGFMVEHSSSGQDWEALDFIDGHGTTLAASLYTYTHKHPSSGINYYRLRQLDFDGATNYSPVINVELEKREFGLRLFPNPAASSVAVIIPDMDMDQEEVELRVSNQVGQVVYSQMAPTNDEILLDLDRLPKGIYLVEVAIRGHQIMRERLLVQ